MAAGAAAGAWVLVLSLWGAVVQGRNVTAQIGKPLVLNCRGVPRKSPQQLEWKLNTGRTEAWKVLSPEGGSWDSVARILPNGSLLLPSVGIQDEGTFRCQAMSRSGKEINYSYQVQVYQIPEKPEIIDPASELKAGVPSKVGTCVSEGGYPEGTLTWHSNRKPLIPDGKGVSVKEETRRHPETGLFTLQSELTVTPTQGEATHYTFSCSFRPGLPRTRPLRTTSIRLSVRNPKPKPESLEIQLVAEPEDGMVALGGTVTLSCETSVQPPPEIHWIKDGTTLPHPPSPVLLLSEVEPQDEGNYSCVVTHPIHGSSESRAVSIGITGERSPTGLVEGLGTLALALGVLGGLGVAALLIGIIVWQRRRRRGQQRKAPENREEEEERAELNQSEEPEAAESSAGGS
ncbi:advanced glycosylation end product-specific receptor isoform X1 [Talpa occidentalis]|uniref:advanced glycosylation end product-specific receptor isoform X1 n=1 Tax=Talpa occidentalis TaxID=50954 RepID=UPI001890B585|nr:advanced glycosylation end product-specific receptor isoform X1 [Talpa occidentalis]